MLTIPGSNGAGAKWAFIWQVGRLVVHNNIIDLVLNLQKSGYAPPFGMQLLGARRVSPYGLRQVLLRRNIIRSVDNNVDATRLPSALWLDSCENVIVGGNIINLNNVIPIKDGGTNGLRVYFSNLADNGNLLQANARALEPLAVYLNEMSTDMDFVLVAL
jgi:hypothetical protein